MHGSASATYFKHCTHALNTLHHQVVTTRYTLGSDEYCELSSISNLPSRRHTWRCKRGFDIICAIFRLNVVVLGPSANKAENLLETFKDKELDFNQQIRRTIIDTSGNRPHITALKEHLSLVNAQLLVLGAEELRKMGSFVRHAIKQLMDVHILVIKSDSLGQLFRATGWKASSVLISLMFAQPVAMHGVQNTILSGLHLCATSWLSSDTSLYLLILHNIKCCCRCRPFDCYGPCGQQSSRNDSMAE